MALPSYFEWSQVRCLHPTSVDCGLSWGRHDLEGLQQAQGWGRPGCGAGGLAVAVSQEHWGQDSVRSGRSGPEGGVWAEPHRPPGSSRLKNVRLPLMGCGLVEGGVVRRGRVAWFGRERTLSDNLGQNLRHPGPVPPTCRSAAVSKNSLGFPPLGLLSFRHLSS